MYEFLIFDADHTLFDFDKAENNAIIKVLNDADFSFNKNTLEIYINLNKLLWEKYEKKEITQNKIKTERFKKFFEQINCKADYKKASEDYLNYLSQGCDLLPNAEELILDLKKTYKLGMLTNGISSVQYPRLENSKLKGIFDTVVVSGDYGISKPDPEIFNILSKKANFFDKTKMLMIGDSLTSDMRGGINYGIDTCWFNPGKKFNSTSIKPIYEISDLRSIYDVLNQRL